MAFLYAKIIETKTARRYIEMCTDTGPLQAGVSADAFKCAEREAKRVVTWGHSGDGSEKYMNLKAMFEERHPFCISLHSLGPFTSTEHPEQLREVMANIRQNGRAKWRTRAGATRYWFDGKFYEL